MLDAGQHVLEAVPELVEESLDLVEGHQARGLTDRGTLVADQVGHRKDRAAVLAFGAHQALIHPGSTALAARPAVGIEVEPGDRCVLLEDAEEAHIRMPDRCLAIGGLDADPEQPLAQGEETVEHLG